ncbi:hypothetical protein NC653_011951 [Populus alba x Populus x berolinensis]|uniref:SHSP domain-containing protein n=1 Tax=Populus alba x Populus x berolinensis TaxID=444605 RepID=A0AAD6R3X2_9ROSI|nr:hypothetical protein NC653_011951 [Populus alba x Populus x berolinensis]
MDSTRPLAKVNDQVYEDIDPKMEWVNQQDSTPYLSVYLQLRIQAATGDRKLKITGKSRQGDNILIRFNKELTVSSDYDLDQIRAKFEGGVLYIKHPKKNISPAMPMDSTKPMAKVSDHVCEDIGSTMEWVKEAGFGSLLVSASQDSSIRSGTQDRGDNEWIRFNKEVIVPSDFDFFTKSIQGFEGGMLYIGPAKPVKENNPKPAAGPQRPANDKPQDQKSGTGFGCSSRASKV